jgi:hypothetical protein
MNPSGQVRGGRFVEPGGGDAAVGSGSVADLKRNFIGSRRQDSPDGKQSSRSWPWADSVVSRQAWGFPRVWPAMTDHGPPAAELGRSGRSGPPKPPAVAALSWVALECWVNEGGSGDDPDDTAWLDQAHASPRRQER